MLYWFLLYNEVNQLYVQYIPSLMDYLPVPLHLASLGHNMHCTELPVLQQESTSYLFYTWWCMSGLIFQFIPPSFPASCPNIHSLGLHCYFCLENKFICTVFLESTPMHEYTILDFLFWTYFTRYARLQGQISTYDPVSFIFMGDMPLYIWTTSSVFIHLLMCIQVA